jgi:hypothetical protein
MNTPSQQPRDPCIAARLPAPLTAQLPWIRCSTVLQQEDGYGGCRVWWPVLLRQRVQRQAAALNRVHHGVHRQPHREGACFPVHWHTLWWHPHISEAARLPVHTARAQGQCSDHFVMAVTDNNDKLVATSRETC